MSIIHTHLYNYAHRAVVSWSLSKVTIYSQANAPWHLLQPKSWHLVRHCVKVFSDRGSTLVIVKKYLCFWIINCHAVCCIDLLIVLGRQAAQPNKAAQLTGWGRLVCYNIISHPPTCARGWAEAVKGWSCSILFIHIYTTTPSGHLVVDHSTSECLFTR